MWLIWCITLYGLNYNNIANNYNHLHIGNLIFIYIYMYIEQFLLQF